MLIHGSFDLCGAPAVMQERPVRSFVGSWEHNSAARQEVCRRCAHYSRVFEEDGLCHTLGTYWFASGRGLTNEQGEAFEISVVYARQRRARYARKTAVENEQEAGR